MSTAHPTAAASSSTRRTPFHVPRPSSESKADWLETSLTTAKGITAAAECLPFPYVKGVFGLVVIILETVEKVKKNRDNVKELCDNVMEIVKIIQDQLSSHGDTAAVKFKGLCEDLEGVLQGILKAVQQMKTEPRGFRSRFKEVVKLDSVADEISGHQVRIQELRSNFVLMAVIDIDLNLHKVPSIGIPSNLPPIQVTQNITKCPPPSRIFHGRKTILDQMHQFFDQDLGNQHIFLLHGLGGAGKTQTALKFIQKSSSRFSDIFLIDTSTLETIDTSLKNIAATKNVGSTADDALQWLSSQPSEWMLLFDNADDPSIDLHRFFPSCTHGNILITSRNPGLRVYAGSHSLVSDMEELDAVELLLNSASEDITAGNKVVAAEIVKALWYLPLAIIQAGAFISKSGVLDKYLDLYKENQAKLLREKPTQSHTDYAWTAYTTWQISFDQLTKQAQTLLQLWSFLHYEGIPEDIFSYASMYKPSPHGPTEEELEKPLEFLSHFMGPNLLWDSLHFMEVTNEIRAYSLVNFDPDKKSFSVHPLVHSWTQTTLTNMQSCHHSVIAIVGMAICGIPEQDMQLASVKLLPHVDSLIHGNGNVKPDFRHAYGRLYWWADRFKDAEQLELAVLEDRRDILGDDHPDTLYAMGGLASIYYKLGELKEAEELDTAVLEKRSTILGEDHPDTLLAMGKLASTYHQLGRLKEAKELGVVVLEKRRKILGEDHPDTLHAMGNLATAYCKLGQLKEAEELDVVVLEKLRKILGEDHPDTLHVMGNLATAYYKLGQLKEAEELEVVVLEKWKKILVEDHPETLIAMGNLALIYHQLGQLKEAEQLEVVVLEKWRKILGEDHPDTLWAMGNLASTYYQLGQLKEAEELDIFVLEKRRKILGEDHPDTLRSMGNVALTYHELGQWKEAEELKVVVLEKRRKILGEDHPETLHAMGNLAATYYALHGFPEAETLYVDLLAKRQARLGDDHPDTLQTIDRLAASRRAMHGFRNRTRFNKVFRLTRV